MEFSGIFDDFCETVVTFPANDNIPLTQNWVIDKQLSEHICRLTERDIGEGLGPSFAAGKFACHIENGAETEFHKSTRRAAQATTSPGHAEIAAFKTLRSAQSDVAPQLLALRQDKQGNDGLIPGGYIDYLVWATVPGKPLAKEEFWRLHPSLRKIIRGKFKVLYSELGSFGFELSHSHIGKIIYDADSQTMHLCGLRAANELDKNVEWNDTLYAYYGLIQVPPVQSWPEDRASWIW
ncbi:hypothetical protein N7527_003450 [Penicillium freii]|nr:hypothetical protein N7527_003450 [Penicillium freii]